MSLWNNTADWIYDVTEYIETGFKVIVKIALGLLIVACIFYALYWIGKALLGFIKYYSQFV